MQEITPKERILKRIREALTAAPVTVKRAIDLDSSVFVPAGATLDVVFAENFVHRGGRFVYCENMEEAVQSLQFLAQDNQWHGHIFCHDESVEPILQWAGITYGKDALDGVLKSVGICACRCLIANDGSILFDASSAGRRIFAQADTIVFVALSEQILPDLRTFWKVRKPGDMPSMTSLWTGLSHFVDVDGTPVPGYGPRQVYLVLIDQMEEA
ncbi:MAG: lactate utilization protein [Bacteroides sp.]|nr:lactate utilization protein [Bacteroides sp.]MCM1169619.1 lactate utilization protein [Bacteroides sp.]